MFEAFPGPADILTSTSSSFRGSLESIGIGVFCICRHWEAPARLARFKEHCLAKLHPFALMPITWKVRSSRRELRLYLNLLEQTDSMMCAEVFVVALSSKFDRRLFESEGVEVIHILSAVKTESHPYTSAARIVEGRLSYEGLLAGARSEAEVQQAQTMASIPT